ncbi:MAG TPA: outer membrane beta-barrel protein [Nonomuraea sp.]|nr:outer membrane beta-barrel protein [Nonomuraea sp.]
MRIPKAVAVMAMGMLLSASALHAQGAEFSLGGGIDLPLGDFDDAAKLGFHGLAGVSVVPTNWPVGIQLDGNYSQFSDDTPADVKFQLIYGTADLVYKFKTSEESKFRPYLIGGGGVYNFKVKGDDVPAGIDDSETKFGINAGAGFDFKAGSAGLFIEGRFHDVFTTGSNTTFIPITIGVRLGGH